MADQTMRMVAEVVDKATAPLRGIQRQLGSIVAPASLKAIQRDFEGVQRSVVATGHSITSGLTPALAGFGVTSLSLAGGIAAITSAIRGFAGSANELRGFSRESGLAVEQLRLLQAVANRAGLGEALGSSVKGFADAMFDFRRRASDGYRFIANFRPELAKQILAAGGDVNKEIMISLEAIDREKNPVIRRKIAEAVGLGPMAELGGGELRKRIEDARKNIGEMPAGAMEGAKRYKEAMDGLSESLGRVKEQLGASLAPELTKLSEAAGEWIRTTGPEVAKGLSESVREIGKVLKEFPWETTKNVVSSIATELKSTVASIGDVIKRVESIITGAKEFLSGSKSGGDGRGVMPEASIPEVVSDPEISSRRLKMDELRRRIDIMSERITRRESEPDPLGSDKKVEDTEGRRKRQELIDQLRKNADEIRALRESKGQEATRQQMSYDAGGVGGAGAGAAKIWAAALSGSGGIGGLGALAGFNGGGFGRPGSPVVPRIPLTGGMREAGRSIRGAVEGGAPSGDGTGTRGSAQMSSMMGWAMDQLRREGVPEGNLRAAAAHLVGQAKSESGLNPNAVHDQGTGFGIYGARDPKGWGDYRGARRSQMVRWLEKNGYARNSAEGQMRYMAREAMTQFPVTRRILMGATPERFESDTNIVTQNFESPAFVNRRSPAVMQAYRTGPGTSAERTGPNAFSRVRSRADLARVSGAADVIHPLGWAGGRDSIGDRAVQRAFDTGVIGAQPTKPVEVNGSGRLTIDLNGFPSGTRTRTSMEGLFKEIELKRGRSLTSADET